MAPTTRDSARGTHYAPPPRRRLRVFSLDPTHARQTGETVVLSVPWEPLSAGPRGARISVEDWFPDGTLIEGVDLDNPYLLAQDGLAPEESNLQFHQQSVYAVLSSLLETLDQARGRRLVWSNVWRDSPDGRGVRPMPVFPHGLRVANAHYAPGEGLSFGAFRAVDDPEGLFPGQWVYGCLSHDIVTHEAGHAFLHEVRPYSLSPDGLDAAAFHEAFADMLAILQHFNLPGLLEEQVTQGGTNIWDKGPFVQLAGEFGRGSGRPDAVREVLTSDKVQPYTAFTEPHERGAVLVAALFEAFFEAYQERIAPLLRVAGGKSVGDATNLPETLVELVCAEARRAASKVLAMAVRAVDYLPPIGITFRGFLDAVIAADTDVHPADRDGFRRSFIEACRRRRIYPSELPGALEPELDIEAVPAMPTRQALIMASNDLADSARPRGRASRSSIQLDRSWRDALLDWAQHNADVLDLDPELVEVDGGNASFRITEDDFPTAVVTARFTQRNRAGEDSAPASLNGVPLIGGTTVIAEGDGRLRHVVHTPVPGIGAEGQERLERLAAEVGRAPLTLGCLTAPTEELVPRRRRRGGQMRMPTPRDAPADPVVAPVSG